MLVDQLRQEYQNRFAAKPEFLWALKFDPKQPRDAHGRWSSGWGELLRTISKPDGGFTYKPSTRTSPTSGFMVSIYKPRELVVDAKQVTGILLAQYVRKNRDLLRFKRNYLGVWHNPENGKVYIDVSRHTKYRREAKRLGKKHDQEAYFDLKAGKSVDLKPNVETKTVSKIDWRTHGGGSRPTDEGTHREGTDSEGDRGDEENPIWEALNAVKYDPAQARDPKGTSTGGQFAAEGRDENGLNFNTGQRVETSHWRQNIAGEYPYDPVQSMDPTYVPPKVQHKVLPGYDVSMWGASHYGSQVITGESAKQMGIEGYDDKGAADKAVSVASRMVQAIAEDTVGSEEILYHAFENVRHTEFTVGDTMKLPLMATSGDAHPTYGIRGDAETQRGQPVVFEFEKGTQMVGYSITRERDLEDIVQPSVEAQFKEQGYLWDEAIVAGGFEVVSVREAYMGSQHYNAFYRKPENKDKTIQIYGKVVRLRQVKTFDPKTKTWVPRG